MADTVLDRFTIGAGKIIPVDHTGPASYTQGGETLGNINLITGITVAGLASLDAILGSGMFTLSGTYQIAAQQTGKGNRKTFLLKWSYGPVSNGVSSVIQATAGSGQTNGTYVVNASTGAAQIQVVIAGGVISSLKILNPGSGYLTAPTFTLVTGGTPGTVTATIGFSSDVEVATGTNLSGETVRIAYMGR